MIPLTKESLAGALVRALEAVENELYEKNRQVGTDAAKENYAAALAGTYRCVGLASAYQILLTELHGLDPSQIPYNPEAILAALRAVAGGEVKP